MRRKVAAGLAVAVLVFFAPLVWLRLTTPIVTPAEAAQADTALIYGAIVRDGTISPLHAERLDAGRALWEAGTVRRLTVSNSARAAQTMRTHLLAAGVPDTALTVDGQATHTPQTCHNAATTPGQSVIHVSQRFHLPRIALHCRGLDLVSQYVMADAADRPRAPLGTLVRVRTMRTVRESALIWAVLLGLYPVKPATE